MFVNLVWESTLCLFTTLLDTPHYQKCPINLVQFVLSFLYLQLKIWELVYQGFFYFLHEVKYSWSKNSGEAWFLKIVLLGQEGPRCPKKWPKMRFLWFGQRSYSYVLFLLEYESTSCAKTRCLGKIWCLNYSSQTSRPMRVMDSLTLFRMGLFRAPHEWLL